MYVFLLLFLLCVPLNDSQPVNSQPITVVPWEAQLRLIAGPLWVERAAQAQAESAWNPLAVSPVGAMGLVQVMPRTLRWWKEMAWVPQTATGFDIPACFVGQHRHMMWLRRYWQDLNKRLAAYNAGQGSVLKAEAYAAEIGWPEPDAWLTKGLINITGKANSRETQGYIRHNTANRASILAKLKTAGSTP